MTSLKQKGIKSVKWNGLATATQVVAQLSQVLILSRLLSPSDFGLMAITMIFINFAQMFFDSGIGNAIIHRQNISDKELSSLYWLNIAVSYILFALLLVVTPAAALIYKEPTLNTLIPLCSVVFLYLPFSQQFMIIMQKNLVFRRIALVTIISSLAGLLTSVGAAMNGWGVYSMPFGQIAFTGIQTILYILLGLSIWRPRFYFAKKDIKPFLSFGLFQMGERTMGFLLSRADQMLLGLLLGTEALGYYNLAYNITAKPMEQINQVITKVMFPVLAKLQGEKQKLRNAYLKLMEVLTFITAPCMLGIAAIAPFLVEVIFGSKWLPTVPLLQVLAFVAFFRSTGNPVGSLLLAKGRADMGFYWTITVAIFQIPAVYIGAVFGGAFGVAAALLCMRLFFSFPNYSFLVKPLIGRCGSVYFRKILAPLLLSVIMLLIVRLSASFISYSLIGLSLAILLGVASYIALNYIFRRSLLKEFIRLLLTKNDQSNA